MPTGFYLRVSRKTIRRGDIVAFVLPKRAHSYAQLRGERTDLLLLKHMLHVGGDFVSRSDRNFCINGVRVGPIAKVDSIGRALPHWPAAGILTHGALLVGSSQPCSFDSPYFGPIHAEQVLGVYRPLTFGIASAASSNGASLHDSPANPPPTARRSSRIQSIPRCPSSETNCSLKMGRLS
jgi:conjugative transfer signal peptidase TraF